MPVDAIGSTSSSNSSWRPVSSSYRPAPTLEAARQGNSIQRGHEGQSVRELQRQLNAAGAQPPLAEDGQFGPKTEAAVKRLQASAGLPVNGVVGSRTVQALQNGSSVEGELSRHNRTAAATATGSSTTTSAPADPQTSNRPLNTLRGILADNHATRNASTEAGSPTAAPATGNQPAGRTVGTPRGTGYYPDASTLEGGFVDKQDKKLNTLQDFLEGKANYVSVALDKNLYRDGDIKYGDKFRIPELEAKYGRPIEFRAVDTGGAFTDKGFSRIDICTRNRAASLDPTINGPLTLRKID